MLPRNGMWKRGGSALHCESPVRLCADTPAPWPPHGFGEYLLVCRCVLRRADPEKGLIQVLEVGAGLFGQEILSVLSRGGGWGLGVWESISL